MDCHVASLQQRPKTRLPRLLTKFRNDKKGGKSGFLRGVPLGEGVGCNNVQPRGRLPPQKSYLGFITNPKNGRVKGLNEVSLDRTYFHFDFSTMTISSFVEFI